MAVDVIAAMDAGVGLERKRWIRPSYVQQEFADLQSPPPNHHQRLPLSVFLVLRHGLLLGNGARHLRKQYWTRPPLGHFGLKSPADHRIGVDQVCCRVNHGAGPVLLSNGTHFCSQ